MVSKEEIIVFQRNFKEFVTNQFNNKYKKYGIKSVRLDPKYVNFSSFRSKILN